MIPSYGTLGTSSRTRPLWISLEFHLNCLPLEYPDVRHVTSRRFLDLSWSERKPQFYSHLTTTSTRNITYMSCTTLYINKFGDYTLNFTYVKEIKSGNMCSKCGAWEFTFLCYLMFIYSKSKTVPSILKSFDINKQKNVCVVEDHISPVFIKLSKM